MSTPASADRRTDPARRIRGLSPHERRLQRRTALLDAALDLFAAGGYAATSVEQLCQAAFVSTKSFYEQFGNREDCYLALFIRTTDQLHEEMLHRLEGLPETEDEATELLLQGFVDTVFADRRRAQVLFGPERLITPAIEARRRVNREWAARFIEGFWQRFGVSGDHHAIGVALIGGMYDLVSLWLIDGDPDDPESVAALIDPLRRFYLAVRRGLTVRAGS
ncbi:TetR/AcrR family transcriptional regulator [Nocardioides limicola]|uniref:TetR/AcrR family transcriptional regulator n=1 Tax=Nocardioides limicola TaxID=2803368 RepID=UPI00193B3169|nr:TetR/AcrR family transcriptional regulator [Nocardioides sp. DJM-14]